jgi:hypothetical protein
VHLASRKLPREQERVAAAYVDQALDFFRAAENPRIGSRPLLYYYSFLNLTKAALLIRRVALPPTANHGLQDPRANQTQRLRFAGQRVSVPGRAHDHSAIFPELLHLLAAPHVCGRSWSVLDVLGSIPSVHRTFNRVTDDDPAFFPIQSFRVLSDGTRIWCRLVARRSDRDVVRTRLRLQRKRAFSRVFHMVAPSDDAEYWYESQPVAGHGAGLDNAIATLAASVRSIGISSLLTASGYRHYASLARPAEFIPELAATYAVAFYLGSITRYKPQDFDKIVGSRFRWLVEEFLATAPTQFVYTIASSLANVEVVKPFAALA